MNEFVIGCVLINLALWFIATTAKHPTVTIMAISAAFFMGAVAGTVEPVWTP